MSEVFIAYICSMLVAVGFFFMLAKSFDKIFRRLDKIEKILKMRIKKV